MSEILQGIVERITYHNPENGFAVLRVAVQGQRNLVTVVGNLTTVNAGEHLEATGNWVTDRNHGRQFKASALQTAPPASAGAIERYLGSGAIRSVGPQLAARIVKVHQEKTLDVLDQSPDFLLQVDGIGPKRLHKIRESWEQQREVRKIMLFLHEQGIGSGATATRIYRNYGQNSISKIRENPYQLADEVKGIGFKTADELAGRLGIRPDSPERASAGVRFALSELAREGHIGYPEAGVAERSTELLGVRREVVASAIDREVDTAQIVREHVLEEPWLFLIPLHRAELGLAHTIRRLLSQPGHPLPPIDFPKALQWAEQELGLELASQQREAIARACRERMLILTGGPGVGKTTLVRAILEIFEAKQAACVLCSPTGRAAKRLSETSGRPAKTIHRLLEFDPIANQFTRDEFQPLEGDLFVVDESSMLDCQLAYQLLRAIPLHAAVIFVGDVDQLPSVGPGSVLADLLLSQQIPVVRLTEVFRQAKESRIITSAYSINAGEIPDLSPGNDLQDFYFVEANEPDAVEEMIVKLVHERITDRFGLDSLQDVQVLSPMNRTQLGTRNLNATLQQALNPRDKQAEMESFGTTYRVGDRVLQTENDYDREVFNGDLGVISRINRIEQEVEIVFDGRPVSYQYSDMVEVQLAYAISIHKSQGSEFPAVVLPVHTQHFVMLQRNLLYTGLTRAKQLAVLVGTRKALNLMVTRHDERQRKTALAIRLQKMN